MPTANAGYHLFNTGDVLTASQVQYNLQNQSIMYFATSAARDSALTGVLAEGMFAYLADTNTTVFYDGAAWQSFGTGDVTGLTAGTGITIVNPTGPVPTISISTGATLTSPKEVATISAVAATGAINIDTLTSAVNIRTVNASGNFTLNVRGDATTTLNSLMTTGDSLTVTFESPNGVTPYYATAYTIDGNAVTPKWLGGTAPIAGNASATDVYMLQIRKTAAATFTCIASLSKFA
jgi:hypothetical protein